MLYLFKFTLDYPVRSLVACAAERAAARHSIRLAAECGACGQPWTRSAPLPQDGALSVLARAWAAQLPQALRPASLLQCFPRLANRLALCWADPALASMLLTELRTDRRGGRRGFPPSVAKELLSLHRNLALGTGAKVAARRFDPWSHQATADR